MGRRSFLPFVMHYILQNRLFLWLLIRVVLFRYLITRFLLGFWRDRFSYRPGWGHDVHDAGPTAKPGLLGHFLIKRI